MPNDHQRLSAAERANLVALLDSELPELEAERLRFKLDHSVSGRHEVDVLRRTWDLLDLLPQPPASPEFTTAALALAGSAVQSDVQLASAAGDVVRQAGRLLALFAAAVAATLLTYALVRWAWPDPSSRLVRELSIAEHLDEYLDVPSVEFLKELDAMPEFHEGAVPQQGAAVDQP